jgi:hypothetical protein
VVNHPFSCVRQAHTNYARCRFRTQAAQMELAPAWRHVWARLIGGRDAPPAPLTSTTTTSSSSSSASDLLSEEALLARLGWCSAEWVRPPPDGQLAIGDAAATSLGEIAATNAAYQVRKQHPKTGSGQTQSLKTMLKRGSGSCSWRRWRLALPAHGSGWWRQCCQAATRRITQAMRSRRCRRWLRGRCATPFFECFPYVCPEPVLAK